MSKRFNNLTPTADEFDWTPPPELRGLGRQELHKHYLRWKESQRRRLIRQRILNDKPFDDLLPQSGDVTTKPSGEPDETL